MIILLLLMVMCLAFMYLGWYTDIKPVHKDIFKTMAIIIVVLLMLLMLSTSLTFIGVEP